jgi:LEA14-like dessication related protein
MRTLTTTLTTAVLALTAACGGSSTPRPYVPPVPFDEPIVAMRDVRLAGAGLTGGSMDIVVSVYNPNDYAVQTPRMSYHLLVDTTRVADGSFDALLELPPHDSAQIKLPATFSYLSMRNAGRGVAAVGTVSYRLVGHIAVGTPYGRLSAPYDRIGRFAPLSIPVSGIGGLLGRQ